MSTDFLAAEIELLDIYRKQPEKLDPNDDPFVTDEAKAIYRAYCEIHENGGAFHIRNVVREAKRYFKDTAVDTIKDIEAVNADPTDFRYLKKRVNQEKLKLHLTEDVLEDLYGTIRRRGELDVDKVRSKVNEIYDSINEYGSGDPFKLRRASDMVQRLDDALAQRASGDGFFRSGDTWIDRYMTYGFAPGSQTTIFSASGLGKTTVKTHLLNRRINLYLPTLSVELEMEDVPLAERMVASRKRIPYQFFHPHLNRNGEIPPHVFKAVEEQRKQLEKASKFYYYNEANLSIADLREMIRETKRRMGVDYLAVFIDLTTMLRDFSEGTRSTADSYQSAVDRLHMLSREENVHIVNIVQANRDLVSNKLKKPEDVYGITPQPRHVKNSAAFEERSRTLIGLNRPKYYLEQMFPDSPENEFEENIMELWFLKQNGGPLGKIKYLFEPETYSLTKYFDEDEEEE